MDNTTMTSNRSSMTFEYDLRDTDYFTEATLDKGLPSQRTAMTDKTVASIGAHMYMKCDSGVPAMLTESREKKNVDVTMMNVKLEAFRMSKSETFDDKAEVCPGDQGTTTVAPMTTPAIPQLPTFNVTYEDGTTCLSATFDMDLAVAYYSKNHSGTILNREFASLNNATVDRTLSHCDNSTAVLAIRDFLSQWVLRLSFTHTPTQFALTQMILSYNLTNFPDANDTNPHTLITSDLHGWNADMGRSLVCRDPTKWSLNTTDSMDSVKEISVGFSKVKVQAFMVNGTWGAEQDCATDGGHTSKIVYIAVGIALAALVIIVLLAFVIWRRRNRATGYESM